LGKQIPIMGCRYITRQQNRLFGEPGLLPRLWGSIGGK
jgi:hypothetical protein